MPASSEPVQSTTFAVPAPRRVSTASTAPDASPSVASPPSPSGSDATVSDSPSPMPAGRTSIVPTLNIVLTPGRKTPLRPVTPRGSLGATLARILTPCGAASPAPSPLARATIAAPAAAAQPRTPSAQWGAAQQEPSVQTSVEAAEESPAPSRGAVAEASARTPLLGSGDGAAATPSRIVGSELYAQLKSARKQEQERGGGATSENIADFCARIGSLCNSIRKEATPHHVLRALDGLDDSPAGADAPAAAERSAGALLPLASSPLRPLPDLHNRLASAAGTPGKEGGQGAGPGVGTPGKPRRSLGLSGAARVPLA